MSRERKEMKNKGGKRRLSFSFFGPYKRFTHRRKCVVKDASLQKENNIRKKKKKLVGLSFQEQLANDGKTAFLLVALLSTPPGAYRAAQVTVLANTTLPFL